MGLSFATDNTKRSKKCPSKNYALKYHWKAKNQLKCGSFEELQRKKDIPSVDLTQQRVLSLPLLMRVSKSAVHIRWLGTVRIRSREGRFSQNIEALLLFLVLTRRYFSGANLFFKDITDIERCTGSRCETSWFAICVYCEMDTFS